MTVLDNESMYTDHVLHLSLHDSDGIRTAVECLTPADCSWQILPLQQSDTCQFIEWFEEEVGPSGLHSCDLHPAPANLCFPLPLKADHCGGRWVITFDTRQPPPF